MGMSSALYSGVSGLNTNSQAMSVIGNNLANSNTIGFKSSRSVFADLLSSSINGAGGSSQVGRGVGLSKVDQIFSQGTFESTESGLDVAIEGEGFFIVKEEGNDTPYYTRAGAFRFDDNGYLINPEGYRVQGKTFDPITDVLSPGDPTDIKVPSSGLIAGKATSTTQVTTNLNASEPILAAAFDPALPGTYSFSSSAQIFDSLGNPHLLTTYFVKTAANNWASHWSAEDTSVPPVVLTGDFPDLVFTSDGLLAGAAATPPVATIGNIPAGSLNWGNGTTNTAIDITFDCTQFNSQSVVISQSQNGFSAGNLTGVDIDPDGIVISSYSNGQQTKVAQLVLGKFINPGGLLLFGSNLYNETTSSGPARTGIPGPELGKIFSSSLEQSNVDMSLEFVKMITVQRGFQANSKIITTVDELLGELINLKR